MDPHYIELLDTDPGVQITILIWKKAIKKNKKVLIWHFLIFSLVKNTCLPTALDCKKKIQKIKDDIALHTVFSAGILYYESQNSDLYLF